METKHENDEMEIDLGAVFQMLLSRWWAILLTAILGAAAGLGITAGLMTPQYRSSAMLYILPRNAEETSMSDLQVGTELVADCVEIAKSNTVLDATIQDVAAQYGEVYTRQEISDMVSVTNDADTRILNISATYENPVIACAVANAVSTETSSQVAAIMQTTPPTVVESAEVSDTPVSPSTKRNMVLGAAVGLVLCCAVLVVRYLVDDSIRTSEDVEKYLGLNVLAVVPQEGRRKAPKK